MQISIDSNESIKITEFHRDQNRKPRYLHGWQTGDCCRPKRNMATERKKEREGEQAAPFFIGHEHA
jgi:hypothetical protein